MRVLPIVLLLAAGSSAAGAAGHQPRLMSHRVTPSVRADTSARLRDSLTNAVLEAIKGKEEQPAESVFLNIKQFKGTQAARLVRIMNNWNLTLGVGCDHCHAAGGMWARDDKVQKQITRDMSAMTGAINRELLVKIPNLKSERPSVSCATCHRGDVKPATEMPGSPPR